MPPGSTAAQVSLSSTQQLHPAAATSHTKTRYTHEHEQMDMQHPEARNRHRAYASLWYMEISQKSHTKAAGASRATKATAAVNPTTTAQD
jgi:hypothetical protein